MPKVFVSYSHDTEIHKERVLALSNRLRLEGVDCSLDRYEPFPSEGWPRWMASQIRGADYVLVVCTEQYARRAQGQEVPGRGLGATWEGQLITQEIYENGGRNSKFVPVILDDKDVLNIPEFLRPVTRFNLGKQSGYEELYRFLTQQPATQKPALGIVRSMPQDKASTWETEPERLIDDSRCFSEPSGPIVVWRLPRGFIVFEDLETRSHATWSTTASYYDYNGDWIHSTHYHESYRWLDRHDALERQLQKLGIPSGDWFLAWIAIKFMVDVREGHVTVSTNGTVSDPSVLDDECATVHPPGRIGLPTRPAHYRPLAASGRMRDHVTEAEDLIGQIIKAGLEDLTKVPDLDERVRRLRRAVRIDLHRLLSETHPSVKNLEEVIDSFNSGLTPLRQWLCELRDATSEAVRCIEEQVV